MTDKKFVKNVKECKEMLPTLTRTLGELADEVDDQQRKLDKAKLGFSCSGAVGGIMTIIGLALLPVTFGASLGLSIAGGVIGGLSAAGNISSLIADKVISSKTLKMAATQLKNYSAKIDAIEKNLPTLKKILSEPAKSKIATKIEESKLLTNEMKTKILTLLGFHEKYTDVPSRLVSRVSALGFTVADLTQNIILASILVTKAGRAGKILTGMTTAGNTVSIAARAGKSVGTAVDVGTDAAATAGKVASSTVKVAGIAIAGAGLALDLGAIIYYAIKILRNRPDEIAERIRTLAESLKESDDEL